MSAQSAPVSPSPRTATLAPGHVVGGRFVVEHAASEDALGSVLRARDQKTNKAIALRVLASGLVEGEAATHVLRTECRSAATLSHRSIVTTYGVGTDPSGAHFVACEWVDGVTVAQLVAKRSAEGERLSLRGAYNVVAHVCNALTAAHAKMPHGALRPTVVWVTKAGRVKVGDFGVARAVVKAAGAAALGANEQASLAPEVKMGGEPSARSDIFGIGALLYQMLTGRSPADDFVAPSQAHPDATPAIDQVLMRCLAGDPAQRFATPDEVRLALLPLVAGAPEVAPEQDFGVEVDVDVDLASQRPPESKVHPVVAPRPAPTPRASQPGGAPKVGQRVSIHEPFRPSMPGGPPPRMSLPGAPPADAAAPAPAAEVDLGVLLSKITENDAPRWMLVKDKLDHGPFSGRELVELILKGEALAQHGLFNMDTGVRKEVGEFPEFVEFLEQYKIKQQQAAHKIALARSETVEKASNAVKFIIAAAVLGVLVIGIGIFLYTRQSGDGDEVADADLADLYDRGDIQIEGTAGILPDPPRGSRRGGRRGGGGGAGGMSYEDAMNQAVNLGDVTSGGGERRLTPADVAGVMNRHINQLFSCVSTELRSGGSLGNVQIDLAIAGNGSVLGASTRQGSPAFRSCIEGRVRRIRFPTFEAPRMGARYAFAVD